MIQKQWDIKGNINVPEEILSAAESRITAELLLQRGVDSIQKIHDFLNPLDMKISLPDVFCDMQKCVERIDFAIKNSEKIIIYGDFDCDGVTSTALLYKTLKYLGANVSYYIPTREYENHGLNTKALVKLIAKEKAKLFITVDCGISDLEEVNFLNSFKLDVIITDHHEAPDELPKAFAILNPKAFNALDKDLPVDVIESLNYLAGAGVAFKLACGLLEFYKKYDFVNELLPLVAVGTIADVVPLLGENRCFVTSGLNLISKGKNPGLQKLLEIAGYQGQNKLTAETVAFAIAPRINAAGRLDTVESAFRLLTSETDAELAVCAENLNNYNKIRQELSDEIFSEALEQIHNESLKNSIILYNENWHIGIIGIVASKLTEKFSKPVFLMTKDENTGLIRCSARSVKGVHLHRLLTENKDLFEGFGGHAMAAGLYFNPQKNSFLQVKEHLSQAIEKLFEENDIKPTLEIDMELASTDITTELIEDISRLEPFGAGNPNPVFAIKNLILKQTNVMGANKNHLKLFFEDDSQRRFECVFWNHDRIDACNESRVDIVFFPKLNTFNNSTTIQLDIQDIKTYTTKTEENSVKILDHRKKTGIYDQICDYLGTTKLKTVVFSENKEISETLAKYKLIAQNLRDRLNIKEGNQIMFFDYPAGADLMKYLCKKSGAKVLHLMNFNNKKLNPDELLKKMSGMMKYASNNRDGNIKISEIACFLGVNDELPNLCLDIFESLNMIEILNREQDYAKIKFLSPVEFTKIKDSDLYPEFCSEVEKIYDFREELLKTPAEEIAKFVQ